MTAPELKYGRRNVAKMIREWDALRQAIRAEGTPAIQTAMDQVEEHIDYAYRADLAAAPAQVRVKPLVWVTRANTTLTSNAYRIGRSYGQAPEPFMVSHGSNIIGWSDSEDGCKRVADQHNRVLTLAALEPQPDPRDAVIARLVEALENRLHDQECPCNACSPMLAALAAAKAVQHG